MRIIPFPSSRTAGPDEASHTSLEAALNGTAEGPGADSWRELREDVRSLAPPMEPEFEHRLRAQILERGARRRQPDVSPANPAGASLAASPVRRATPADFLASPAPRATPADFAASPAQQTTQASPASARELPHRRFPRRRFPGRWSAKGGVAAATAIAAVVAAVVLVAWPGAPRSVVRAPESPVRGFSAAGAGTSAPASRPPVANAGRAGAGAGTSAAASRPPVANTGRVNGDNAAVQTVPLPAGPVTGQGRVQQLAASLSLSTAPGEVQPTADRVARLAASEEGFVQSSHVQVQREGASEATLMLTLPSRRLSAALASLGQLAPVRAENQSLQDITDTYDAARRRLADATAERRALLRALAAATTEGQLDSLRERLSQARASVGQARSALHTVSQSASTAGVEVTVLGNAHAGDEGLTLHRGLHDAGRVLLIALVALILAAAVLLPLVLLLAALAGGRRAWRRYQRERILDAP